MIPPEQDTEVFSVPDQGSCSCQQLHPATQKQQPVSGADGSLLLPSFQAHPREILCGPPGYLCKGIRPDFVLGMCMRDEIKCVDIFNFYVNATYMMTDLNDFFFKEKRKTFSFPPFSLRCGVKEGQVVRISFSNMFKEFKSSPTWLQFPFLCGAAKDSVYESTAKSARRGNIHAPTCNHRIHTYNLHMGMLVCIYFDCLVYLHVLLQYWHYILYVFFWVQVWWVQLLL